MANLSTITLAPGTQPDFDSKIRSFGAWATELPLLDEQRVTRYLPAVYGLDAKSDVSNMPAPPDLDQAPAVRDVGYLATRYASWKFWDRINQVSQNRPHPSRKLGAIILSKIPGAAAIRDDVMLAAPQLRYYRSQSDDELASTYPGVTHVRRKLFVYEIRSTVRNAIYHALEAPLVHAETAEQTVRSAGRQLRVRLADLLHLQLPPRYYDAKDHLREWTRYSLQPSVEAAVAAPIGEHESLPDSPITLDISDRPTLQFAAAVTLGSSPDQGPFAPEKPHYRTLRSVIPASAMHLTHAPATVPLKRAPRTTPLPTQPDMRPPQPLQSTRLPWIARVARHFAYTYLTYQDYGRTLSMGLHPPPLSVYPLTPSAPRQPRSAPRDRNRVQDMPLYRLRYPEYRQAAYPVSDHQSEAYEPRYARFAIPQADGGQVTKTIWGIGPAFYQRVRDWRIINPRARLVDTGTTFPHQRITQPQQPSSHL